MNSTPVLIAVLILLPAVGLLTWVWFAMARVEEQLRSFTVFEGLHFEIGPQAVEDYEGTRWPIPG